jgi:hypothetical protein
MVMVFAADAAFAADWIPTSEVAVSKDAATVATMRFDTTRIFLPFMTSLSGRTKTARPGTTTVDLKENLAPLLPEKNKRLAKNDIRYVVVRNNFLSVLSRSSNVSWAE